MPRLLRQVRGPVFQLDARYSGHVAGVDAHEHRVVIRWMSSNRGVKTLAKR
jgi:hypothetical protein